MYVGGTGMGTGEVGRGDLMGAPFLRTTED